MRPILYFGHPVNTYNTELEKILIAKILRTFPNCIVENPNQEKHRIGYERWKIKTGNGMTYYFSEVLPFCHGGIFLPFRDGAWGAGVYGEAEFFASKNGSSKVLEIDWKAQVRMVRLESAVRLTVQETRRRVYGENGILLPY